MWHLGHSCYSTWIEHCFLLPVDKKIAVIINIYRESFIAYLFHYYYIISLCIKEHLIGLLLYVIILKKKHARNWL